jgi:signal transduction histidine kinase
VRSHLSARSRLTLLYTSLFALGGAALVTITYLLVAHSLHRTTPTTIPRSIQPALEKCLQAASQRGGVRSDVMQKCADVYASGVQAGASAQRSTTLTHLLTYSLLGLAGVTLLAVAAGWVVAGRILRPVHRLTAAARAASEQNLSQRIALQGPRDELRELADTFDTMLERLDRAFTSQRQFIANASHELRTPLTVMRTAIDVVLAKPQPTREELVSMAAEVRQAVDHAERLIEALLVLARHDQPRALTDPLDLAPVAEDALEGRTANGITTITTLAEAPVTGDRVLLERLVTNLLDNAERYNIAGGTVTISTSAHDTMSVLRVVNTGTVVPADMVERLFQPFTRLDDRTRHDGHGLGLTLVASIAAVHGGTVNATAVPTGGLDISVRLPRRGNAVSPASPATRTPASHQLNTCGRAPTPPRPGAALPECSCPSSLQSAPTSPASSRPQHPSAGSTSSRAGPAADHARSRFPTAEGPRSWSIDEHHQTGSRFGFPAEPRPLQTVTVGPARVDILSCRHGRSRRCTTSPAPSATRPAEPTTTSRPLASTATA